MSLNLVFGANERNHSQYIADKCEGQYGSCRGMRGKYQVNINIYRNQVLSSFPRVTSNFKSVIPAYDIKLSIEVDHPSLPKNSRSSTSLFSHLKPSLRLCRSTPSYPSIPQPQISPIRTKTLHLKLFSPFLDNDLLER